MYKLHTILILFASFILLTTPAFAGNWGAGGGGGDTHGYGNWNTGGSYGYSRGGYDYYSFSHGPVGDIGGNGGSGGSGGGVSCHTVSCYSAPNICGWVNKGTMRVCTSSSPPCDGGPLDGRDLCHGDGRDSRF